MLGAEVHNGVELEKNDYVISAMMLYIDLIMIFSYIYQLFISQDSDGMGDYEDGEHAYVFV